MIMRSIGPVLAGLLPGIGAGQGGQLTSKVTWIGNAYGGSERWVSTRPATWSWRITAAAAAAQSIQPSS